VPGARRRAAAAGTTGAVFRAARTSLAMPLPAVLTIQSGINQLRYATLKGIMAAKKKEIRKAPPPPAAAATQTQTKPASAVAPGQRARDPWQEAVPEALKPIRDRLERGPRLSEGALGPAYAFARQNPGDPRPWLLIAHAYAQLDWLSDSVERYQRAYRADPTCRGDPQMLEDLLKAAAHRVAGRNAARAIRDIYGAEALPALEKAIARGAGDRDGNDSLDHLRDSLTQ
jgi:hypothetical protein